jgi:hypothetical protein
MKKSLHFAIVFLLLSASFNCFCQTELPTKDSKKFKWEESKQGKTFEVSFKYGLDVGDIPKELLESVVMNAVIQSKYKLKNTLSFRPIEVMIYGKSDDLKLVVEYSGKNAYGVESIARSYFEFKNSGDGSLKLVGTF